MSNLITDPALSNTIHPKTTHYFSLHGYVEQALKNYLSKLNGTSTTGLYETVLVEVEVPLLKVALKHYTTQTEVAKKLGLSRTTLKNKLIKHQKQLEEKFSQHSLYVEEDINTLPLYRQVEQTIKNYLTQVESQSITQFYETVIQAMELPLFIVILQYFNTQVEAAKILGLSRSTLRKKLMNYQLI